MRGAVQLVSLPRIFFRLDETINNPYSNLSDVTDILLDDPSLCARLLRIANSSLYNFPSAIDTVSHAVTIIGTKQLRDLVLATAVMERFGAIPQDRVDMRSFWQHSIACGIAARVIATHRRETNIERFYVLGLLHDVGRLVIYMRLPDLANQTLMRCVEHNELLYEVEKEWLGFDHAAVGGALLKGWRLPDAIQEAVACHHKPLAATRYPKDAAIVHVADILANALQLGSSGEHIVPPLSNEAWLAIGLSENLLPSIVAHIDVQYRAALDIFMEP